MFHRLNWMIENFIRLVRKLRRKHSNRSELARLTRRGCGIVDSGVPDLASNPDYLQGFGRDAIRRPLPLIHPEA